MTRVRSGWRTATVAATLLVIAGCGGAAAAPAIIEVRPAAVAPGGMVLVSGRGFDARGSVLLGGGAPAAFTWVNAGLLTVSVPGDAAAGDLVLEVRNAAGGRATASVRVITPSTPPSALPPVVSVPPPPAATPPQAHVVQATPAVPARQASQPPQGGGDDDKGRGKDKDKDKPDRGNRHGR